jgi:hypothetical protein
MSALRIVNEPSLGDIINKAYKFNKNIRLLKNMISSCYGYKCQICSIDMKGYPSIRNIDHIIPRSIIAISEFWNLELLCSSCNREKGSHMLADWKKRCRNAVESIYILPKGVSYSREFKIVLSAIFVTKAPLMETELKKLYKDDEINKNWGSYSQYAINTIKELVLFDDDSNLEEIIVNSIKKDTVKNDSIIRYIAKLIKNKQI